MTPRHGFTRLIWPTVLAIGFSGCGDPHVGTIDGTRPPRTEAVAPAPVTKPSKTNRPPKVKKIDRLNDLSPQLPSGESR